MLGNLAGDVQETINKYFSSSTEEERKDNWNKLMTYFQFFMRRPRDIRFRIIKNKDSQYPILIFKNHVTQSKLLIPVIPNRIIKLNLSEFIETGLSTDILASLTFDNRKYKVYNDVSLNKKPLLFENTAS